MSGPTANTLVELALQTSISIGGDVSVCGGVSAALRGRMTVAEALTRLLARSRCTFEEVDARTYRIRLSPPVRRVAAPAVVLPPRPPRPAPPLSSPSLAEIVVTALRRPVLAHRAPLAISVLSGSQLAESGATDVSSLQFQVAGLTVTNLGAGRDKILLRGQSDGAFTGSTQSTVPIYLDDVPITYNAPDPDLRLIDVDRVEVLRGPQGSLYGAGSIGGLLRIVTRKPDLDVWGGSITATGSATPSGGINSAFEGVVNIPVVPGRLGVRLVGYREQESGWIDDVRLGLDNVNRTSRDGGRVSAQLSVAPGWTVDAGLTHQSINLADTQYVNAALGGLNRANDVREPHDNDFDQAFASLVGRGGWGTLKASASSLHHRLDTRFDTTLANARFDIAPLAPSALDEARLIDLLVTEVTAASPERGPLRWLVGGFAAESGEVYRSNLAILAGGASAYRETRNDERRELAAYGEVTYDFSPHWSATAGARLFASSLTTTSLVEQPALPSSSRTFRGEVKTVGAAPKLVLSYHPLEPLLIYVQASQGYRAGGFNTGGLLGQVFADVSGAGEPARRFVPDQLWNYEAGAKLRLYRSRVSVRTAAYYSTWDSIQTDQFLSSGLPYTVNVGDGVIAGLEVEAAWQATQSLSLRGAGLIDDPQLTRERNAAFPSRSDAGLPGVPTVSFSASADFKRPLANGVILLANAQFAYVGASNVTFDAQTVARMGSYSVTKLRAGLAKDPWKIEAFVDNLGDVRGNTFAFGNPFSFLATEQVTPLRPLTVGIKLGLRF